MTGWMKALLIAATSATGAAAVAAGVYFGLPYLQQKTLAAPPAAVTSSTSPDFTKSAYQIDSNGNLVLDSNGDPVPFTGTSQPGDEIEYVLTYKPPTTGVSGPVTITDTLSGNQSYVDPSIEAPSGWTYPTNPGYPGNTETYSNPGFGPGTGMTMTVPPMGPGLGNANGTHGDGFQPIPVASAGNVYSVWHHMPERQQDGSYLYAGAMCWKLSDLSACPGFPQEFTAAGADRLITPNWPHAVVVGNKIYFPAGREEANNTTADFGIGCWDTASETACPFIPLPGNPTFTFFWSSISTTYKGGLSSAFLAGLATDPAQPTHLIVNAKNQLYCIDSTTSTSCAGWASSPPLSGVVNPGEYRDLIGEDIAGGRVFVEYNGDTSSSRIACRVLANGANCPGWALIGGSSEAILSPRTSRYLTISAVPNGPPGSGSVAVCAHQAARGAPSCVKTADGTTYSMPPIFSTPGSPFDGTGNSNSNSGNSGTGRYVIAPFHMPGGRRVLYSEYIYQTKPPCFDFATNAACAGFNPAWNSNNNNPPNPVLNDSRDYGYASDPTDPEHCFLGLGDHEIIWRFRDDGAMGRGVCTQQHVQQIFNINDQFCAHKPKHVTWTNVEIVGRPTELVGGTIVVKDSSGTVVQTITVTSANSYALNVPATGVDAALSVEFTPNYGTSTPPTTSYQIKLDYTADADPQICYKTKILDCTETLVQGPVTNTAVYTDTNGTNQASVNLGNVTGGHCGPPPCLTGLQTAITLNPNGTATLTLTGSGPPGFTPTVLNLHSNTPGVTVIPPSRTLPSGPINTGFILTGVTPGQSVDVRIDAVDPGAGTNGSDKCCSSTVTVTVPRENHHHFDVGIQKTGVAEGQGPANGSGYTYTLAVTNVGDPINGQNAVTVTDVVPVGLSFASVSGSGWTCPGPFPIAAGGTLTCTYTGNTTFTTGQSLPPITVVSTNAVPGAQLPMITNCADVAFTPNSGYVDTNSQNDRSCTTNGNATHTGWLKIIKVIEGQGVVPNSAFAFQARVSCTPPGGTASVSMLTLNHADSFTQTIPNLVSGTVCSIAEQPAPGSPSLPGNCHWVTHYPEGQNITTTVGSTTARIVNAMDCRGKPTPNVSVEVYKMIVLDGAETRVPHESFPIHARCVTPDGSRVNLSYTASVAAGFHSRRKTVASGSKCTIHESPPPPPPGFAQCHWTTRYLLNGRRVHSFPVRVGTHRTNHFTVRNELVCRSGPQRCPSGTVWQRGEGCVRVQNRCGAHGHWNGKRCVVCASGDLWNDERKVCTVHILHCDAPMVPNAAGTVCSCPEGMKLEGGKCKKKGSFLNDLFDHVHIGIGIGGSSGSRGHHGSEVGPKGGGVGP